jgi:organic hydroperoxide reductase OsmC/OhrA
MAREHHFAARLVWTGAAQGPIKDYDSYSREYRIEVAGKPPIEGSSDPTFGGDAGRLNPEDLLVMAIAACHMLSYLALCARAGIAVAAYEDRASGKMAIKDRRMRFVEVTLAPEVRVAAGDLERARALHEDAHAACFIASSVNFPVVNTPTVTRA